MSNTQLVRFSISEIDDRLPAFEKYGKEQLRSAVASAIENAGLPALREAYEHPWNDDEYLVLDGVSAEHLPAIEQVAREIGTRYQYPCHRDVSAFGDGGRWYDFSAVR